jgi:integrase
MSVRKRTWVTRLGEEKEAWVVAYSVFDGESYARHIKTFDKKKEAEAYHDSVRVDVRAGRHQAPSRSLTIAEAGDKWIKQAEANNRERAVIKNYRTHLRLHILPHLGRVKLANLTTDKVEKFRDDLLAETSRNTAREVLVSFKMLLKLSKYAHVAQDVKIEKGNGRGKLRVEAGRHYPTPAEIKRIINAAKGARMRALLLTAALTGLRASELRGLRWRDVDLKAAELEVAQRADRYNVIGAPKSESSARRVPLAPEVVNALREWKVECPPNPGGIVFPTGTGAIQHHRNMAVSLEPVMRRAHVLDAKGNPKYSLHAFRHFFASWCINRRDKGGRELPPKDVQALLGHSSIVMTLDRYGHLFPHRGDQAELAEASAALLG